MSDTVKDKTSAGDLLRMTAEVAAAKERSRAGQEGDGEAELLLVVGDPAQAVLAPAIRA